MSSKKGITLRRKRTVCICIIVYAALCVLAFHSFTSIAVGLIVIVVAAVKLKKYNDEIKMDEKTESIMEWIGSMSDEESEKFFAESRQRMLDEIEEEYGAPNATYSTADLLGTSSDDEDDAGEEDEESDDEEFEYDEKMAEEIESWAEWIGSMSDEEREKFFAESRQRVLDEIEEEYDDPNATYSTADLLGTSSSKTTKKTKNTKTTKTTKTRKPRK